MRYGLGIDTGGTYTDAVIFDFEGSNILSSAKSLTIKEDLTAGICNTLDKLPHEMLEKVRLVSLSTTLATNACVEGKGCRARLVLIGCDREIAEKYGKKYGLPDTSEIIFLDGGHNQQGEITEEPDWDFLKEKVTGCGYKTDAFAIVELWGIKNPEYEMKVKELILSWTGTQAVCGYELTGEVNSLKRAASALLNAQLIPLINDFLDAVRKSMKAKGIEAPLVIVRGDGSLMSEEFARGKPVETLLSGPAASIAGAMSLIGEKDCVVVDMGGTTSDLAIVKNGRPGLALEGANVGNWKTGIKSIAINTIGLGGDSLIRHKNEFTLTIGPARVAPLTWLAARWPYITDKIKALHELKKRHTVSLCEFFYLIKDISGDPYYTENENSMIAALKNGPLSISELAEVTGISIYEINAARLERLGIIMRCGLTPTDIMHITGDFTEWEKDAAFFGADIMANQLDITRKALIETIYDSIREKLYVNIVRLLLENEHAELIEKGISKQLDELMSISFRKGIQNTGSRENLKDFFGCSFSTKAKLIGIGAPTHIFLPAVAEILGAECIIPEKASVANAVGAITGNIVVEENVNIRPVSSATVGITGYLGFSRFEKRTFLEYNEALKWADGALREMVVRIAAERGAVDVDTSIFVEDNEAIVLNVNTKKKNKLLIETVVKARATGKIKWI